VGAGGGTSRQGSNSPRGKRVMGGSGREAVGEGKREAQRSAQVSGANTRRGP
jgi:hypothetical protein